MNFKKLPLFLAMACIAGSLSIMSGCATTGADRAAKTTTSMRDVQTDIDQAAMQVDATNASLDDLVNPGQPNITESFKKYSANVAKMDKTAKRLDRHTEQMKSRGNNYFEEWDKQENRYTNPQIQALSEQRRTELRETYSQISASSVGMRGALDAYVKDIKEIQKYLSTDMTPKGVEAITPVVQRAKEEGNKLKEVIRPVQAAIQRTQAEMTPGSPR
ncbi:DUF2959 family protein [Pelotalea chapellei]|uniref:DUF2959 family protein n=1 Tax=Pelotalea chapellei TaxID=44671 RepID=A0ABS5U5W3_9BACT|nr:DUF2959 family protein [Pelotalea chapellei]MBT1071054.1 DUF2959 family protein [Pelotalea chapellei]